MFCQSCSIIAGERNVEEKLAHLFHAANAIYCPEHLYLQLLELNILENAKHYLLDFLCVE